MAKRRPWDGGEYPKRLEHVVWKVIEGKGILLNLESGAYFEVGPVGLSIWQKCDGRNSSRAIVRSVAREFGAGSERVQRDFLAFSVELRRRELLEFSPAPSAGEAAVPKRTR